MHRSPAKFVSFSIMLFLRKCFTRSDLQTTISLGKLAKKLEQGHKRRLLLSDIFSKGDPLETCRKCQYWNPDRRSVVLISWSCPAMLLELVFCIHVLRNDALAWTAWLATCEEVWLGKWDDMNRVMWCRDAQVADVKQYGIFINLPGQKQSLQKTAILGLNMLTMFCGEESCPQMLISVLAIGNFSMTMIDSACQASRMIVQRWTESEVM